MVFHFGSKIMGCYPAHRRICTLVESPHLPRCCPNHNTKVF